jgi:hypothetical protein
MNAQVQEFERAVMCAFDMALISAETDQAGARIREQASQYCEQVKSSSEGWSLNLALVIATTRPEARFYALQTLQELLTAHKGRLMPEQCRTQVRTTILEWLVSGGSFDLTQEAPYIKNKIAVVLALIIKCDYPERWPSAFEDCKQVCLPRGPAFLDLHLRIFRTIDEEIVEFNAQVIHWSSESIKAPSFHFQHNSAKVYHTQTRLEGRLLYTRSNSSFVCCLLSSAPSGRDRPQYGHQRFDASHKRNCRRFRRMALIAGDVHEYSSEASPGLSDHART